MSDDEHCVVRAANLNQLGPNFWKDYYIFHYTYGIEYTMHGEPMLNTIGEWSLDKVRQYINCFQPFKELSELVLRAFHKQSVSCPRGKYQYSPMVGGLSGGCLFLQPLSEKHTPAADLPLDSGHLGDRCPLNL